MTNINTFQGIVGIGTDAPTAGFNARTTGNSSGLGVELRSERIDNNGYFSFFKMKNIDFTTTPVFHFKAYEYLESQNSGGGYPIFLVEGSQGSNFLHIEQNGNVGIGTTNPVNTMHIYKASNDQTTGLFIEKATGASGTASLFFGVTANAGETNNVGVPKAGILFQRTAGNGRGDLKFCVDYVDDTNAVGVADAKMTITGSNGWVGIGTTNPGTKLQVGSSGETVPQYIRIRGERINEAGDICGLQMYNSVNSGDRGNSAIINSRGTDNYASALQFWTNPGGNTPATQKMVIDQNGNVGIGTNAPGYKLHVVGDIYSTGNITAYSDKRAKENIEKIENALDKVCTLGGYTYTMKGQKYTGLIAQEVLEVLPEAVTGSEETNYALAYGNMMGLIVEAIKELKEKIG